MCRFWPAIQRMLQLLCCLTLNCLNPSLKGAAVDEPHMNESLVTLGELPHFQILTKKV